MHGWLIIDKPVGPGSTQIVSAVKRALREGGYPRLKVGHGGTLDPLASGVLPVALGEATKLCGRMLDSDKTYEFTLRFGEETSTLDADGEVVERSDARPSLAQLETVLARFTGTIDQVPPAFSALKVEGRRAYELARAGEAVPLKVRSVTVHELELISSPGRGGGPAKPVEGYQPRSLRALAEEAEALTPLHRTSCSPPPPLGEELQEVTLHARVSKGTYIRSLARDIAHALDTVGHVTMLRRTKAGPFRLESAISLDKLAGLAKARELEQALMPLTAGLDDIPALPVTPDQARALRQGRRLVGIAATQGLYLATEGPVPVALVEAMPGAELRVVRGFNL